MKCYGTAILKAGICLVFVVLFAIPSPALGQENKATGFGVSFTAGAGLFIASDKEYYYDISTDLYPEVGIMADISIVRAGLKFGLIYRKFEEWNESWDSYTYDYYYGTQTMAYLPAQLELLLAPFPGDFSPYIGVMGGVFVPIGDNDDTPMAFSLKAGIEGKMDMLLIYADVRYTIANTTAEHRIYDSYFDQYDYADEDVNAGGIMLVIGGGLRFGN